ncbi:vWA domain-containing protein [Thalassobacillus devorans]|uniref:vWA domain-containing protein n=1 Tax=Thalassobacillus devorans TaxID=279813 RepID=UPI000A1CA83A|nr:VWA domain-containing protein [Thalassobacillus devorans]
MSKSVSFTYALQYPYVPTTGKDSLYLLLELTADDVKALNRSPINLSVVLDRSGSMTGKPLEYCKEASKFVVNQLSDQDLMNMVVFDGEVDTLFDAQPVTHKDGLKNTIDAIETRGITNLSGGLIQGCQNVLQQPVDDYVNRVLLLSDGVANAGITDIDQLKYITEDYNTAGAVMTTMGVSEHFDEELLETIADAGKGTFYFIDKVEAIPDIFAKELEGLLSVVGQNVTLTLNPAEGVSIKSVLGYEARETAGGVEIKLGDLYAKEMKSLLIECAVPPGMEGEEEVMQVAGSFVDVTERAKPHSFVHPVSVTYTKDLGKLTQFSDPEVDKVQITKSAQTLEQALQLFDEGDFEEGKNLLYSNISHMEDMANELGDEELLVESAVMKEKLADFDYSKQTRKELHAEKYRQMKRRKRD